MYMQRSNFSLPDVEKYGTGAGIIPVARAPTGEVFLLLGRERFLPQWKGSCRWSGFEGSRKSNEPLPETAVREFTEESLGVVFSSEDVVRSIVRDKSYWLRVVLRISSEKRAERYHTTYVVGVPYDQSVVTRFAKKRQDIECLDRMSREMERAFPTFALMSGHEVELGDVDFMADGSILLYRFVGKECESESAAGTREGFYMRCLEAQEEDVSDDDDDRLTWCAVPDQHDGGVQVLHLSAEHPYTARVKAWESIRKRLEDSMVCRHPCVLIRKGKKFERLQDLRVHTDHLEKDQIRWWSSTDLRRVMDSRGFLGNDCFRPYFLPVLQTVLHELSHTPPSLYHIPSTTTHESTTTATATTKATTTTTCEECEVLRNDAATES